MSEQSTQDQRYQGWANYPTWAVNLWMANDEPMYREAVDMAETALRESPEDRNVAAGIWTPDETARFRLADSYREWLEELATLDEASFRADLLGWAFQQVDWEEIAVSWLDSVEL